MVGFAAFYLLPFALGVYYSMMDMPDRGGFVGFSHYRDLFRNELFRTALMNTARFTFLSLGLMLIVSFGAAYALHFTGIGRFIPRSLLYLPLTVPAVSISFVWLWLFHFRGHISSWAYSLFGSDLNLLAGNHLYIPLLALYLWKYAGFSILIYLAGFSRLPTEQLDAYRLESKNRLRLIWMVLLPHERPRTFYVLLLNLIFSMGIFREIYAVWAHYPPRQLYMIQHFVYNNFIRLHYERAAAGAVILAVFILTILAVLVVWERRRVHE
jgi:multiple sugar transport system permease protein